MRRLVSIISVLWLSMGVQAQDVQRGKQLYQANNCIMCHGENGQGNRSHLGPRIGGQHDWYLLTALTDFQARDRRNPEMFPFIQNLTQNDFKDLAAYIVQLSGLE